MTTVPHSTIDTFHSLLMDDDRFNEAVMRVALQVAASYNAPGQPMTEEDYELANQLCCLISVG